MSQPIISLEAYTCAHMEAKRSVEEYLRIGKSNYQTLSKDIREQLKHNTAMYLHANNPYSRIAFTECVVDDMDEILKGIATDAPAYFVTLVLSDFAVEYDETVTFDVETIKILTKKALRGVNAVAMVEAALYTNITLNRGHSNRTVSWHVHMLVWDTPVEKLKTRLNKINNQHACLVPGFDPTHCMRVNTEEAEKLLIYMLKAPMKEYRIARKRPGIDWETGEIFPTNGFRQWKRDLRSGDRVRMCKVMADQYLHHLYFGMGAGRQVYAQVEKKMLAEVRRHEGRQE
jgi:hypothetical protein